MRMHPTVENFEKGKITMNNGKISNRQTFRLYVFDLMGIATLLLPPYLAKMCGTGGIYAILLGTGGGLLYLFYLGWIMRKMDSDIVTYLRKSVPLWLGKCTYLAILLHSILTGGFCAYVFANLMQHSLVEDSSYGAILFLIVLVAAYAVRGGIESRARVYEVLFWLILIPYIAMMLASVRDFEVTYVQGILNPMARNLLEGSYLVFLLLTPLFFSLFLVGEKDKNYGGNIVKITAGSVLFSAVILLVSYILLLGNFGANSLAQIRFPIVTLMSTIQFEGNFLKRMDALMLAVWFFTLYALLNLHLHYGVRMCSELANWKEKRSSWWQIVLPAVGVFAVAYSMHRDGSWLPIFLMYYSYVAVPFMVVLPVVLLLARRKKSDEKKVD